MPSPKIPPSNKANKIVMQQHGTKQRVIVYIDGYNLYYGQREEYGDSYNWLDLQALATSFLKPDMELISVKYFTATRGGETGSKRRQQIYLKALQEHCDKLDVAFRTIMNVSVEE